MLGEGEEDNGRLGGCDGEGNGWDQQITENGREGLELARKGMIGREGRGEAWLGVAGNSVVKGRVSSGRDKEVKRARMGVTMTMEGVGVAGKKEGMS